MKPDFSGIEEKLKRTKENILNLDVEVRRFLETGKYPSVLPYEDKKLLLEGSAYHKERIIPLRFSVLAGEIIHHLRSCLDHVVWEFSGQWYRESKQQTRIQFPVLEVRPVNKPIRTGYEGKVKGISDPGALILIEMLQPCNTADPIRTSPLIIHKMDIMDKHRTLVLCGTTMAFDIPIEIFNRFMSYQRGEPGSSPVDIGAEFKRNPYIYAQVAFKEFGRLKNEPLIQGLERLFNWVAMVAKRFDALSQYVDPFPY
jgi:hypothetical protein